VDEVIDLFRDLADSWSPGFYIGMGRHEKFGYPKEWPERAETSKKLRIGFIENTLPTFMKYFGDYLKKDGGRKFFCGNTPTIADFAVFTQFESFQGGFIDHVPKTCLDKYTDIIAWMKRVRDLFA